MATNYTPEEIQDIFDRYNQELQNTGKVSKQLAEEFADAQKGVKNYTYQLNQSLKQLGTSFKNTMGALKDGQTGASTFNNAIESSADVIDKFASKFGIIGTVIGGVVKAASAYTTAVNKQADALYKSYQEISRAGAIGAGGMSETFDTMRRFGYGIEQLGDLGALLRAQGANLSIFSGSALQGSRELAAVADGIQHSDLKRQFMNMGMSVDDINKGIAGYMNLYTRLGYTQGKTTAELQAGAAAYLKEMEGLSRLTGMQREEMEQELDRAQSQDAFYATLAQMDPAQAKKIQAAYLIIQKTAPQYAEEFANQVSGFVGLNGKTELFMATAGKSATAMDKLKNSTGTTEEALGDYFDELGTGLETTKQTRLGLGQVNAGLDVYGKLNEAEALRMRIANGKLRQGFGQVTKEVNAVGDGADELTNSMTETNIANMNTRDAMQGFLQKGIIPVTNAMNTLANVVDKVSNKLLPGSAMSKPGGTPAGGSRIGGATPGGTGELANIRSMIAGVESGGNYNVMQGGSTAPLTGMTLGQVLSLQSSVIQQGGNSAAGKYQITRKTLMGLMGKLGLTGAEKFDEAMQDRMADELIRQRGYDAYKSGKLSKSDFLANLSKEWAGLPGNVSGSSYYEGTAGNKSGMGWQQAMNSFDLGGIATGPTSGYRAMLHGTEAVVPLPDGRTIPVEMRGLTDTMERQMGLMTAQLSKLDDIARVMQNQVGISQKILNYTH